MIEVDVAGQPVEVRGLDADWLLEMVGASEVQSRVAERRKLRLAAQWCVLHEVSDPDAAEVWAGAGKAGGGCEETIGGEGTPLLAEFTAEPFGAAMGVSTFAAMRWLATALDLEHRLPLIWRLAEDLVVPVWKARKVAELTHALSMEAAGFVDAELSPVLATRGMPTIERVVAAAIARFHPDLADARQKKGKAGWGVRLSRYSPVDWDGTSFLDASGDTVDLTRFHTVVTELAHRLGQAGDLDTFEQRKAKALGLIADLHEGADLDELLASVSARAQTQTDDGAGDSTPTPRPGHESGGEPNPGGATGARPRTRRPGGRRPAPVKIHVHVSLADLATGRAAPGPPAPGPAASGIAEVDGLGPATLDLIGQWAARHGASVQPVLDLAATDTVDAHDPPEPMAEQVRQRDRTCVFPFCDRDSRRCDLDHIVAYDEHGPPGQTHPENLAPLCRRHHRCKTHGRWRYARNRDGTYTWSSPQSRTYLVTEHGTLDLPGH